MNENPGETPNPLNPSPVTGPAPTPTPTSTPSVAQPVAPVTPATSVAPAEPVVPAQPVSPLSPADRPMEKANPAEVEPQKKKTGLIAGIIAVIAVLAIGGVAVAVAMMMLNKTDPVTAAMNKIMSGNAPTNIAIDGDINIAINDKFSPVSNVKIALDSKVITNSMINNSVAKVTATIRNVGDLTVEFDEVYAGNGDLYFKMDGAMKALEGSGILNLLNSTNQTPNVSDCGDDEDCQVTETEEIICDEENNCSFSDVNVLDGGQIVSDVGIIEYFASMSDIIDVIDGEWLKISLDELNALSGSITSTSNVSCITDLVSDINTNSNSAAELYSKYPFISSTNENVQLASKNYPVYQISIDSKSFANYVNSIQNSTMTANLYSCLGWTDNVSISEDDVAEIVNIMPKIYTEIDNDNNFARLYMNSSLNEGEVTVTIDLGFSYPTNVNVPEPEEYRDLSDVIQEIMSSMYSLPTRADGIVIDTVDI